MPSVGGKGSDIISRLLCDVVMSINTTTSALLYKHAFMATWLEWWTVVAS